MKEIDDYNDTLTDWMYCHEINRSLHFLKRNINYQLGLDLDKIRTLAQHMATYGRQFLERHNNDLDVANSIMCLHDLTKENTEF
jgi:hypothetical protein